MGPFKRGRARQQKSSDWDALEAELTAPAVAEADAPEAVEPEAIEPEAVAPDAVEPAEGIAPEAESHDDVPTATSSEYRRVGDDLALLTVEIPTGDAGVAAAARLSAPDAVAVVHPEPSSVTIRPGADRARLVFVVDRHLPEHDGLAIDAGPQLTFAVPAPVERPAIGDTRTDLSDAAVSGLVGEELFGLIAMLEKRCSVAERVAADFRAQPTEARKLVQAYREIWDLRALLDSREDTYRRSADAVQTAEKARDEAEAAAAAATAELDGLKDTVAKLEAAVADAEGIRDKLATATAESDELAQERDEARAAAEALGSELEATRSAVEEWSAEAERARTHLAAAVARAEELEAERDDALVLAQNCEIELAEVRMAVAASAEQADAASAELGAATARADALQRERDEAVGGVDALRRQIDAGREALEEAESRLESERTLYEARIVSGVETERKLYREVEELKARLGEKRKARSEALRQQPGSISDSVIDAQRERLRQTSLEEQRAEVAALERQLERLKQGSGDAAHAR